MKEQLNEQAVVTALEAFKAEHADGFYYEETLHSFSIQKLQQLEPTTSFTYIRLFNKHAQLTIRKTRFGYEAIQIQPSLSGKHVKERAILIEKNVIHDPTYNKLLLDVYEHETAGYIEHWKGVE